VIVVAVVAFFSIVIVVTNEIDALMNAVPSSLLLPVHARTTFPSCSLAPSVWKPDPILANDLVIRSFLLNYYQYYCQ
jgi:hypothetical protein